jgi:hypothetical protein
MEDGQMGVIVERERDDIVILEECILPFCMLIILYLTTMRVLVRTMSIYKKTFICRL